MALTIAPKAYRQNLLRDKLGNKAYLKSNREQRRRLREPYIIWIKGRRISLEPKIL